MTQHMRSLDATSEDSKSIFARTSKRGYDGIVAEMTILAAWYGTDWMSMSTYVDLKSICFGEYPN